MRNPNSPYRGDTPFLPLFLLPYSQCVTDIHSTGRGRGHHYLPVSSGLRWDWGYGWAGESKQFYLMAENKWTPLHKKHRTSWFHLNRSGNIANCRWWQAQGFPTSFGVNMAWVPVSWSAHLSTFSWSSFHWVTKPRPGVGSLPASNHRTMQTITLPTWPCRKWQQSPVPLSLWYGKNLTPNERNSLPPPDGIHTRVSPDQVCYDQ